MIRRSFTTKRLVALLLPLAIFWSWAGCLSVCAEIVAQHHHESAAEANEKHAACDEADDCRVTANAVVLSERQTLNQPAPPAEFPPLLSPLRAFNPAWAALLPEINQHSPPKTSVPLFLRLHNFRI